MSGLLIMRDLCDVQRRSVTAQGYGGKPAYAAHLTDEPCHYETRNQRGFNSITAQYEVTSVHMVLLRADSDVQEGDRVTNIRLNRQASDLVANSSGVALTFQVDGGAIARRGRVTRLQELSLRMVQ